MINPLFSSFFTRMSPPSPPLSATLRNPMMQFPAGRMNDVISHRRQLLDGNFLVLGNTQIQNSMFSASVTFPPEWNIPIVAARGQSWDMMCFSMIRALEMFFAAQIVRADLPTGTTFTLTDSTVNCLEIFFAITTAADV